MFSSSSGYWYLHSDIDDRWNCSGDCAIYSVFYMPKECENKLNELKEKYKDSPKDLKWGCMKD